MAYTVLRGHRCAIVIPNVHTSTQDERMFRAVNFATGKMLTVKVHNFLTSSIHKQTWNSPVRKTHNQTDYILVGRRWYSSILGGPPFRGADGDTDHCKS
jgi:hypothetical protein